MSDPTALDLRALVGDWLDESEAAAALGVTAAQLKTMVRRRETAAVAPSPGAPRLMPALFVQDGEVVKGLGGLLTLLHDGGYDDLEIVAWVFTDADLPGRPIDALRENRGSEVKRRAQAMAL